MWICRRPTSGAALYCYWQNNSLLGITCIFWHKRRTSTHFQHTLCLKALPTQRPLNAWCSERNAAASLKPPQLRATSTQNKQQAACWSSLLLGVSLRAGEGWEGVSHSRRGESGVFWWQNGYKYTPSMLCPAVSSVLSKWAELCLSEPSTQSA